MCATCGCGRPDEQSRSDDAAPAGVTSAEVIRSSQEEAESATDALDDVLETQREAVERPADEAAASR